ncbi:heme-binding protein [Erwinia sp. Eh17-17]|uniref:GlcG/HbpS family heme-binding protein n=1 Tax=Erwinia sp. Eh17-17 TaxID=3080330 RepID=UPI00320B3262
MKNILLTASLTLASFSALAAPADVQNLTLTQANQLAQATIQSCSASGYNVSVTVVDRAGITLAVQRMDNAGPHTVEASQMKAYTALSTKNPTSKVMEAAQANKGAENMRDIPGFLLLAGGVPVKAGEQVIGAIGVGGAPGGQLDQQCAEAALKGMTSK